MKGYDAARLPARGRAGAHRARAVGRRRGPHGLDRRRPPLRGLRPARSAAAAAARARARRARWPRALRARRPRALARHAGVRPHGRRADDVHERLLRRLPGRRTRRRCSPRPGRSRRRRRSSACGSRTRSRPRRWSTSRPLRPGMKESEAAAIWEGHVHGDGTGSSGMSSSRSASRSSGRARGSGLSRRPAAARRQKASRRCSRSGSAPTATGATTRRTSAPGRSTPRYEELPRQLLAVYDDAVAFCRPGASLAELDRLIRDGIAAAGYPGQPSHPIATASAPAPTSRRTPTRPAAARSSEGMVLAIEPGIYWPEGGGLRLEDNFLVTADGAEKLSPVPRRLPLMVRA